MKLFSAVALVLLQNAFGQDDSRFQAISACLPAGEGTFAIFSVAFQPDTQQEGKQACLEENESLARVDSTVAFNSLNNFLFPVLVSEGIASKFWIGVEDPAPTTGTQLGQTFSDPNRFEYVDGLQDNTAFFSLVGQIPWADDEPKFENCVV